jgi:hypothetical protein
MPLWVPEWFVGVVGRVTCRVLRWHNVTCRGRRDHQVREVGYAGIASYRLIDPHRWGCWPRR